MCPFPYVAGMFLSLLIYCNTRTLVSGYLIAFPVTDTNYAEIGSLGLGEARCFFIASVLSTFVMGQTFKPVNFKPWYQNNYNIGVGRLYLRMTNTICFYMKSI